MPTEPQLPPVIIDPNNEPLPPRQPLGCLTLIKPLIALFVAAIIGATVVACSDPEFDEDFADEAPDVSDEELTVRDDETDINAQIWRELAEQDAQLIESQSRPLTSWEKCVYIARRKNLNPTDKCASIPPNQMQ